MKWMTALLLSGGLLFITATPVNAHQAGHHGYDRPYGYYYGYERRRSMPRWLRRKDGFRHWYRHSPYRFHYALSWARVYEIYRWERRHGRRFDGRRYRHRDYHRDHNRRFDDDRPRRRRQHSH